MVVATITENINNSRTEVIAMPIFGKLTVVIFEKDPFIYNENGLNVFSTAEGLPDK